jgi:probable addiction module antidote protein
MAHRGPEDHLDLLNDALATGDASVIANIIGEIARARGMSEVARESGVGRSALYKALGKDGNPTLETMLPVLRVLGIDLKAAAREAEPA